MKKIRIIVNELEVREFISSHSGEIKGLYHDRFSKMGGWNGLVHALAEVENREGVEIMMDEIIPTENSHSNCVEDENIFERIISEEL